MGYVKKLNLKAEDIKITRINIQVENVGKYEWLVYRISYTYKGQKHSYNFRIISHSKNSNGKILSGLSAVDKKLLMKKFKKL